MRTTSFLTTVLRPVVGLLAALLAPCGFAADAETVTIKTLRAQMRYDVTEFDVRPGQTVKLVFRNEDDMPHNLCFFQPGTDVVEAANKQMEKPEEALKRNWLPDDPRMWLHSKMVNPAEVDELTFTAPAKPGIYPYVCTFPGHAAVMQGKMKVSAPGPRLTDLKFRLYLGAWKNLPDFAKLKPHREGDVPDNELQLKLDDYKNEFGVVFTGKLKAPKEGEYTFALASDDGAKILIDGREVVANDGIHPAGAIREGKAKLKEGIHDFRLDYFQAGGQAELFVAWRGPGFSTTPLSKWLHPEWKSAGKAKKKVETTGMPIVVGSEPVIYRNFVAGAGERGIAVGYPGGFNIAWSAGFFDLALVWRGAFMDAARHWTSRGGGMQPPAGFDVFRPTPEGGLPFAIDPKADSEWPVLAKGERADGYRWKGYTLDKQRFPTFEYEWNGVKVTERFDTMGDAVAGLGRLIRTIRLDGKIPAGAMMRIANGASITAADGAFVVDNGTLQLDDVQHRNQFKVAADGAKVVGKNLVVPAAAEIKVTYSWLFSHGQHVHSK